MAYDPVTGLITPPVGIPDLMKIMKVTLTRVVNGRTQRRISGDLGVLLGAKVGDKIPASDGLGNWEVSSREDINIWSKFKPVHLLRTIDTTGQFNFSTNKWKDNATWMHGSPIANYTINSYGLAVQHDTTVANVIEKYKQGDSMNGWIYNRPKGGADSPYRLTDCAYYCHKAAAFGDNFLVNNPIVNSQNKAYITAQFMYSVDDEYAVNPENLMGGSKYFGIVVVNANNNSVAGYMTSDTPGIPTVEAEVDNLNVGTTYTVYPFLAESPIEWGSPQASNKFYSLPLLQPVNITPKRSSDDHGGLVVVARYMSIMDKDFTTVDIKDTISVTIKNTYGYAYNEVYFEIFNGTAWKNTDPKSEVFSIAAGQTLIKKVSNASEREYPYEKVRLYYKLVGTEQTYKTFDTAIAYTPE